MQNSYTVEQYQLCLLGAESNDSSENIAKASGMPVATVKKYISPKQLPWLKQKANGKIVRATTNMNHAQAARSSKCTTFQSPILNDIFDRLTPIQKLQFEQEMIAVILRQTFCK